MATSASGLSFAVHPMVLLSVSDHYTRVRMQSAEQQQVPRVIGALYGTQANRDIALVNSFEIPPPADGRVDRAYLLDKQDKFKQIFPDLDFLGWYAVGQEPTAEDVALHQQFAEHVESPVFLLLSAGARAADDKRDLPFDLYESAVDPNGAVRFVAAACSIKMSDAERISVDQVAKSAQGTGNKAAEAIIAHLVSQRNATLMLAERLRFLAEYIKAVRAGELPADHAVLREVKSLCQRLPSLPQFGSGDDTFEKELQRDFDDVLLLGHLSAIVKGSSALYEVIEKFNAAFAEKKQRGQGGFSSHHREFANIDFSSYDMDI